MSAGAGAILGALLDHAKALGGLERARLTEFKGAPGNGLSFALWMQTLGSSPSGSGLASTAGLLHATARLYIPALTKPEDQVEVRITDAADGYLGRLHGAFTLGGLVRDIDLLGEMGEPMQWKYGYLTIDNTMFRVADLEIYVVLNDAWTQAA